MGLVRHPTRQEMVLASGDTPFALDGAVCVERARRRARDARLVNSTDALEFE